MPGWVLRSLTSSRMSIAAPIASTKAIATSATTSPSRTRRWPALIVLRPLVCCSADCIAGFAPAITAGATPARRQRPCRPRAGTRTRASRRRSRGRAAGRSRDLEQLSRSPRGDQQADDPADERQHQAFGDQLPHETSAAGPERGANGDFPGANGHPRQREVGDVRAGERQQQADRAEQQEQHAANRRRDHGIGQRLEIDRASRLASGMSSSMRRAIAFSSLSAAASRRRASTGR